MFKLDTKAAQEADSGGGRIAEIGKYVGRFLTAEYTTARTGTTGILYQFETDDGQHARLRTYIEKQDGTHLGGYRTLMAIMTCLRIKELPDPTPAKIKKRIEGQDQEVTIQNFRDLCGKPIGVLLETEDYEKQDGSTGTSMVIAGVFDPSSDLVATEILKKEATPALLPKMIERLRHRPLKNRQASKQQQPSSGFDDESDDIPF